MSKPPGFPKPDAIPPIPAAIIGFPIIDPAAIPAYGAKSFKNGAASPTGRNIAFSIGCVILGKKAEMIDRAAKAKAAGEGIPQQSVMDQIMSSNAQAENPQEMGQMPPPMPQQNQMAQRPPAMQQPQQPQGPADVGIASNPVPPMQMAGGGIIAFDEGGDVDTDEDYQEMIDDANQESMNSQIYEMINQLKMPEKSTNIGILSGYQSPEKSPES